MAVRGYYQAVSNPVLRFVVQMNGFQKLLHINLPTDVRPVKMLGPRPVDYDSVGLGWGLGMHFFNELSKDSAFQAGLWALGLDLKENRDHYGLGWSEKDWEVRISTGSSNMGKFR